MTAQESEHEVLTPDIEWVPTQLKSLDEVVHDHAVLLRELPDRQAVLKSMNGTTVRIRTIDVKAAFASERRLDAFTREALASSPYASSVADVEREIEERRARLTRLADEPVAALPPPLKDKGWG
jgi:hypothetical protein